MPALSASERATIIFNGTHCKPRVSLIRTIPAKMPSCCHFPSPMLPYACMSFTWGDDRVPFYFPVIEHDFVAVNGDVSAS